MMLSRRQFVLRDEHFGVDGARDVEEGASDTLHTYYAVFIKFLCGCGVGGVLHLGLIRRRDPFVGRVLGEWGHGVLEALQGFGDRVGHGDFYVIAREVPFDVKPAVIAARWADSDGVIFPERIEEVGGVVGGKELDTKLVYSKGEGGR